MSYEIYYQRAFIKIGDDKYIPIIQHGSNNCFEVTWNNRQIPEKNWNCLNYPKYGQYIFSAEEIKEIATICDKFDHSKSRYRSFEEGEYSRWFIGGMKSAQPLEYYIENGNSFFILDWTTDEQTTHYVRTTEELLDKLQEFNKPGISLSLKFYERDLHLPKKHRASHIQRQIDNFWVLVNTTSKTEQYFHSLTRYGYKYCSYADSGKKFANENEINRYLKKYKDRLKGFSPKFENKPCYI